MELISALDQRGASLEAVRGRSVQRPGQHGTVARTTEVQGRVRRDPVQRGRSRAGVAERMPACQHLLEHQRQTVNVGGAVNELGPEFSAAYRALMGPSSQAGRQPEQGSDAELGDTGDAVRRLHVIRIELRDGLQGPCCSCKQSST